MKHLLLKTWLMLVCLILGVGTTWAEEVVYKTALFGSSYNSQGVSSYSNSWTATNNGFTVNLANWNNNNNGWSYIRAGHKNTAYVGTITTAAAIDKAVTKIVVTIDAITAANVTSIKLYSGSAADACTTEIGSFDKSTGNKTVTINTPTTNKFYKIAFDCIAKTTGCVQVSKIQYYYDNSSDGGGGDKDPVAVTGVTLDQTSLSLKVGKTATLTATVTPNDADNKNISWSSNNPNVATVDNGVVTAVAPGNATITVTTEDGTFSATCNVTVTENVATYANTYTSGDGLLTTTEGTSTSEASVKWDNESYSAIKAGTSSAVGAIKVTVPANTKTIHFHAAGWNGETTKVKITGLASDKEVSLKADAGVSGSSPFTLQSDPETNHYYSVDTNNDEELTLTFTATTGKRFVLFGVNAEADATKYNVKFYVDGEEQTGLAQKVVEGGNPTAVTEPTKTGYTFDGWYEASDFSGSKITDVTSVTISANKNFYGRFNINNYTITYNNVADATHSNPATYTIETATINLADASKEGFIFQGWYDNEDFTGERVTTIAQGSTGNKTFWAKWAEVPANPSTVTFNVGEHGTCATASSTEETVGAGVALPSVTANEGWVFKGWSTENPATAETIVSAGDDGMYHILANTTLYAYYKVKPATPTFSSETGAIEKGTEVTISCTTEGATIHYTTNGDEPTVESAAFSEAIAVNAEQTIKAIAILDGEQSEVATAAYTIATHTARFSINGEVTDANNCIVAKGEAITFPADPAAPEEHVFIGWKKGGDEVTTPQDEAIATVDKATEVMGTEAVTYYAVWAVQANSTFSADDITNTPAVTGESLSWADTNTGVKLHLSAGSRYTTGTPNTFTVNSGTTNYFQITADKNITKVVTTISATDYKINIVSAGTLNTSSTTQTVTGISSKDFKAYATSSKQIRATQIVVTTASDFCTAVKAVTGVAVKTAPTTVAYCEGEKFNPAGLEVTLTYDDKTTEDVAYSNVTASKFTFAPALDAALTTSNDHVAITIKGQTANLAISVRSVSISAPVVTDGTYTVKVGDAPAVTADGNTINALKGQKIVLASTPATGYKLHSTPFVVKDEDDANVSVSTAGGQYSFTMPGKNVTITAQFTRVYTVTAGSCEHGSITAIKDKDGEALTETSKGSKVVVEATADTHYYLTSMYYVKAGEETQNAISESEGVYSFTMPQSNVTVYATFAEDEKVTMTWSINGNTDRTSEVYVGEAIAFPTDVEDINGMVFRGWVSETDKDYTSDNVAPTYANAGTVNATAAATYYAVFATAIPGEDEEKTSTLTLNDDNVTSPYSDQDVTWNFSGLTFCSSNQQTSGMPNGASVSFTLPENAKAETFTITSTSNSWSTSNISLSLKYGETQITSFNNAGKYDFTESNNDKGAYSLTASNKSSKVAYIKTLSIKYLVHSTSYEDYCTKVKTTPTLSFAEPTYNATMGDAFDAPTLTNEQNVTVSYSSSEEGVATVDSETGAITLVAPGTTTITATFAGNATYNEVSASYQLVVAAATATITIASACTDGEKCYSTYSNASAFVVPEGLTVSTVGVDSEGKLVVNSYNTGDVVAANTGVMVSGAAGDHIVTLTNADATAAPGANNLHPSSEAMTGDNLFYRLTMHNGETIGFWWGAADGAAFSLTANKAYLAVPNNVSLTQGMWFGDNLITGLNTITVDSNAARYDLQGRVVSKATKGIQIMNGRKVIR